MRIHSKRGCVARLRSAVPRRKQQGGVQLAEPGAVCVAVYPSERLGLVLIERSRAIEAIESARHALRTADRE
jgi:hypothetical protein